MVQANIELILMGVLGSDSSEIVCRAAAARIRIPLQQLRRDPIECVRRNQIARIGAMIRWAKNLAYSRLDGIAVCVNDTHRIRRDCCSDRTVRLEEE